ncbi:MAG TPA: molybdate ABC transporter substrate-binding protein [bacterium]
MKRIVAVAMLLVLTAPAVRGAQGGLVVVAAAADARFALDELATLFMQRQGIQVQITYGSSGQLATQIEQGAPFDLFFSADEQLIRHLSTQGLIAEQTEQIYGIGRIVLWVRNDSPIDPRRGLHVLTDDRIRFIAIANPEHAPYGKAAAQALRAGGLWDRVHTKLVLGENISQTLQFARTGNADVGIVALSLAVAPPVQPNGRYWLIPASLHDPIRQAAGVVARSPRLEHAKAFLAFVTGLEGGQVLRRYGFTLPGESQ